MLFIIVFLISGVFLALLLLGKRFEEKTRRRFFFLRLVSLGDVHARELSHKSIHLYAEIKEKGGLFWTRQLPMQVKSSFLKLESRVDEKFSAWTRELRNSKLLKKNDGISEFLKSVSEIERGNGTIDETFADSNESASE